MSKAKPDDISCAGCGRLVDPGDRAVEIRIGKLLESQVSNGKRKPGRPRLRSEKFKAQSLWGVMHLACFVSSLESADDVFDQLRGHNAG